MADDQAEMARMKAHSTIGQAIEIGRMLVQTHRHRFANADFTAYG